MRVSFSTPLRAPAGAEAGRVNSPDTLCINTIRTLVMDAVQNANSGHPGAAMSMAPIAYTLWQNTLNYDPTAPLWPNRDRFVLSIGHAPCCFTRLFMLQASGRLPTARLRTNRP